MRILVDKFETVPPSRLQWHHRRALGSIAVIGDEWERSDALQQSQGGSNPTASAALMPQRGRKCIISALRKGCVLCSERNGEPEPRLLFPYRHISCLRLH